MIMSYVLGETISSIQHNGSGVPVEPSNNTMKVEPESIHAFLQAACAGLGFDIGEVWWYSDPKGPSSKNKDVNSSNSSFIDIQNSVGDSVSVAIESPTLPSCKHVGCTLTRCSRQCLKFVQLYTSKAYDSQRPKLVCPASLSRDHPDVADVNKHILSPKLIEAVCKSNEGIVWANSDPSQKDGLLGRSDMKLHTVIGMPFAVDNDGNMCVVVMFSPNYVTYSADAMNHLKFIARSATSRRIPCMVPLAISNFPMSKGLLPPPALTSYDHSSPNTAKFSRESLLSSLEDEKSSDLILPSKEHTETDLGNGVRAKVFAYRDRDDSSIDSNYSNSIRDGVSPVDALTAAMANPLYGSVGSPTISVDDSQFGDNSYGVWSTIMNVDLIDQLNETSETSRRSSLSKIPTVSSQDMLTSKEIRSRALSDASLLDFAFSTLFEEEEESTKIMENICSRLEEFAQGFLGMSVFDIADIWIPYAEGDNLLLTHLTSVTKDPFNEDFITFKDFSRRAKIMLGCGAPGRAFGLSKPIWCSDPKIFVDSKRAHAFHQARIKTVLSVPILTNGSACAGVLNCYSQINTESNVHVLMFVQQALKLLYHGLDTMVPHASIEPSAWKDVAPIDIGKMAANEDMQLEFSRKRPIEEVVAPLADVSIRSQKVPHNEKTISKGNKIACVNDISQFTLDSNSDYERLLETAQSLVDHSAKFSDSLGTVLPHTDSERLSSAHASAKLSPFENHQKDTVKVKGRSENPKQTLNVLPTLATGKNMNSSHHMTAIKSNHLNHTNYGQPITYLNATNPMSTPIHHPNILPNFPVVTSIPSGDIGTKQSPVTSGAPVSNSSVSHPMFPHIFGVSNTCLPVGNPSFQSMFRTCRIEGCDVPVYGRKPYCVDHRGTRYCEHAGCKKCAQGTTRFCIAHGGGRRCTYPGCDKGARDKKFCAAHGGGKRCTHPGCTKSAVGGKLCTSHGGGKRCQAEGCNKAAQASTKFCVKHGGGRKCSAEGCEKVARGKTKFCATHGGGVRCRVEGCTRAAIRRQQLCRKHGPAANSLERLNINEVLSKGVAGNQV